MKTTNTSTEDRMMTRLQSANGASGTESKNADQEGRPFVPLPHPQPTLIARALDEQVNLEIPLLKPVAD
uniref:Uncharacterized protein n=1 Tax=Magallana gigas TaxID=29159 RepID=K1QZ78_MAGGI